MLTRILVMSDELLGEATRIASGLGAEATAADGDEYPPGTAAILAGGGALKSAVGAAVRLGNEQQILLRLLADAIDCREEIPLGGSERVRQHAERLAAVLKLSPADQLTLERAALVRDIGKLRIGNDVLLKKQLLTYDEFTLLQAHTLLGEEMLNEVGVLRDTRDIVRYHHENYDGTGYPDRLEKDDIPLGARVMRLLDVYCAMTSPRVYRASHATHEEALEHLQEERGNHFDPEIVDAFIKGEVGRPMEVRP